MENWQLVVIVDLTKLEKIVELPLWLTFNKNKDYLFLVFDNGWIRTYEQVLRIG